MRPWQGGEVLWGFQARDRDRQAYIMTHLPERTLLSQHSYQHASRDHKAGQQPHEDAQQLGPGGEAVAAILGRLVLDYAVHQQGLQVGVPTLTGGSTLCPESATSAPGLDLTP